MIRWLAVALAVAFPAPGWAEGMSGVWRAAGADSGYLHIRLGPCGYEIEQIYAQVVSVVDMQFEDRVGLAVLTGMKPAGPGRWAEGQVLFPGSERVHPARAVVTGDTLSVRGCVALLCQGQVWTRVE